MVRVLPVSPAGTAHDATARVRLVIMVTAARRSVHVAEILNPVTQKLGNVGGVTLDGLDPGVHTRLTILYLSYSEGYRIICGFSCFRPTDNPFYKILHETRFLNVLDPNILIMPTIIELTSCHICQRHGGKC